MWILVLIAAFIGLGSCNFLEDGKEYVYTIATYQNSGTMDYRASAAALSWKGKLTMQVDGDVINFRATENKVSEYVGAFDVLDWPWSGNSFVDIPDPGDFSVKYKDGQAVSIDVPSKFSTEEKNIARSIASAWQIKLGKGPFFEADEHLMHGDCKVQYTVTEGKVTKAVSHMRDCINRKFRLVDNFKGYRCDGEYAWEAFQHKGKNTKGRESPEPLYSNSNIMFFVEEKGGKYQVNKMVGGGAVVAQFYESEGVSHFVHVNRTLTLVDVRSSDGSISPPNGKQIGLAYEFSDEDYKWNIKRDLKAAEPYLSSGVSSSASQSQLQATAEDLIAKIYTGFGEHGTDQKTMEKLHKHGVNSAVPAIVQLDYYSLNALFKKLKADPSQAKLNLFIEYVSEAGTSAAAIFFKDALQNNKLSDVSLATRALTTLPFSIRRPSVQLVEELAPIYEDASKDFLKIVGPLALAHLIEKTCSVAGPPTSPEHHQCNQQLKEPWTQKYFDKFQSSTEKEEKYLALSFIINLKSPKAMELLRPTAYGEVSGIDDSLQIYALQGCFIGTMYTQSTIEFFLPIFMNAKNGHESRIMAVEHVFMALDVDLDTLSTIMTQMYIENDMEVRNYVSSLFEKHATDYNGCTSPKKKDRIKYFIKYMKQAGVYDFKTDLGVSKTYTQGYADEKYGFGGYSTVYVLGSHKSSSPALLALTLGTTLHGGYKNDLITIELRVEGLVKGVLKQIKKMEENVWKLDDLAAVFNSMGVTLKPDQKIKVGYRILLKNVVISLRSYDSSATSDGGELKEILNELKGQSKNQYNMMYQRVFSWGSMSYEQPSESGLPMAYFSRLTSLLSIEGTYKKGINKGEIFRDFDYDIHLSNQHGNMMLFYWPMIGHYFSIVQDRVINSHFPRHIKIGFLFSKKRLNLEFTRPDVDSPYMTVMHSHTKVMIQGASGDVDITPYCSTCPSQEVISNGPSSMKSKVMQDETSEYLGSMIKSEYFDCEADISDASLVAGGLSSFSPFNKEPKTLMTYLQMGFRSMRAYYLYFPKVEQCGVYLKASQSAVNPVKQINCELTFTSQVDRSKKKTRILDQDNMKYLFKLVVTAKAHVPSKDRKFTFLLAYKPGSMGIQNTFQSQAKWEDNKQFNLKDYIICFQMENKYPSLGASPLELDLNTELELTGEASVHYGEASKCNEAPGLNKVSYKQSTTSLAREELKGKGFYNDCMAQRQSTEWRSSVTPFTPACWFAVVDSNVARKYTWDINLVKNSPRVNGWLDRIFSLIKTAGTPYLNVDFAALEGAIKDTSNINVEFEYKENDKVLDATFITDKGTTKFPDGALSLPESNLRQLRVHSGMIGVLTTLSSCMVTSENIRTLDNTTYSYKPSSCWSLVSGHCAPSPTFAVFTRKNANLPLAMMAYIGGHKLEFLPTSAKKVNIKMDGSSLGPIRDMSEKQVKQGNTVIFSIVRWGPVYTVSSTVEAFSLSLPNVFIVYDGTFAQVFPPPNVKGQHCGACGNFDGNKNNDFLNKAGIPVDSKNMAKSWCQ